MRSGDIKAAGPIVNTQAGYAAPAKAGPPPSPGACAGMLLTSGDTLPVGRAQDSLCSLSVTLPESAACRADGLEPGMDF